MARSRSTTATAPAAPASTASAADTKSLKVVGTTVRASVTVRKDAAANAHEIQVELDFSGVSTEQLLVWAARTRIIDLQRALRSCDEEFLASLEKDVLRRHASAAGQGFADPGKVRTSIASAFAGLSAEDKAALLELLKSQA